MMAHEQTTIDGGSVPHPPKSEFDLERSALPAPRNMSLETAQWFVAAQLRPGSKCPCCGQRAQLYRRKLNRTMVEALRLLYRAGAATWFVHAQSVFRDAGTGNKFGGDVGKLALWGLVAEDDRKREDGGRAGHWRLTTDGYRFLVNEHRVQRYALVYNGRCLGHEGDHVGVRDVVPEFKLDELLSGI